MFLSIQFESSCSSIGSRPVAQPISTQDRLRAVGARGVAHGYSPDRLRVVEAHGAVHAYSPDHPINVRLESTNIKKPQKKDTFEDTFINKMKIHLNELDLNLDSLADKQIGLHQFKIDFSKNINQYWDVSQENNDLNSLLSMLETSIENLHVEDIQKPQINMLEKMLDVIQIGDISEDATESIFYEIINCGLDPIGSLAGISQVYDD